MSNRNLFKSVNKRVVPTNTVNEAGGVAYALSDKEALAQLVVTGCLNGTYYATESEQLNSIKGYANKVPADFIAKTAVYGRTKARMKDTPAYLLAYLFAKGHTNLVKSIFNDVIDDVKMLCNFVQIVRSGETGRSSFGTLGKKLIQDWIVSKSAISLFKMSIGHSSPSLVDIIKMVHPKAKDSIQNNMFKYLMELDYSVEMLPEDVRAFELFKKDSSGNVPNVDFRLLSNVKMSKSQWIDVAKNMGWTTLRMNLNTLDRNGVFTDSKAVDLVAAKLSDKEAVMKSKVMPYQIMTAYKNTTCSSQKINNALQDALEYATENVPNFGSVAVCVDVSGSMGSPITGSRGSVTSKVTCLDIGGLMASCILRKSDDADVILFDTTARPIGLNSRDSVATNTENISKRLGGGTDCSCAMRHLNAQKSTKKLVIFVSDNESWVRGPSYLGQSALKQEWDTYKKRVKDAKLVLIDIQPYSTTQAQTSKDILNVGGFNDSVFEVISRFLESGDGFSSVIDAINV